MKLKFFKKLCLFLFACIMLSFGVQAQDNDAPKAPEQRTEVMTENDRIPFMQTEGISESDDPGSGSMIFKTFGAMFLIIGLLFFGAWGVKKYGLFGVRVGDAPDRSELEISSTKNVANGQTISVVRFRDRVLLIGSTAQSFTLLADEPAENQLVSNPKSVSDLLAEENENFQLSLTKAQSRFEGWNEIGGKLS